MAENNSGTVDISRVLKRLNYAINLLGGISDIYTNENRIRLHKAYDVLWDIEHYLERTGE